MLTCPLCEHPQAEGLECDVCGKDLSGLLGDLGEMPIQVEPLPDLEIFVPGPDAPPAPLEGLEPTALARVAVAPEVLPELEVTAFPAADIGDVSLDPTLEPTALDGTEAFVSPLPEGPVACRYCNHVQEEGSLCDRCGMRLPRRAGAAELPLLVPLEVELAAASRRCRQCGSPVVEALGRCANCGSLAESS